eukprot:5232570-Pleurochrysis_carterae.AAC.2
MRQHGNGSAEAAHAMQPSSRDGVPSPPPTCSLSHCTPRPPSAPHTARAHACMPSTSGVPARGSHTTISLFAQPEASCSEPDGRRHRVTKEPSETEAGHENGCGETSAGLGKLRREREAGKLGERIEPPYQKSKIRLRGLACARA